MTHDPREPDTFEQDLEAVQAEWERMERAEPPDLVDQAVLNAARRDLEAKRGRLPLRWLGGFATATVVVLALTLHIQREQPIPTVPGDEADFLQMDRALPASDDATAEVLLLEQAPLPPAEPTAPAREVRREKHALRSAIPPQESAVAEIRNDAQEDPAEFRKQHAPAVAKSTAGVLAEEELADAAEVVEAEVLIQKLLDLKNGGDEEQLAEELAAFRERYPDYPLPDELAALEP